MCSSEGCNATVLIADFFVAISIDSGQDASKVNSLSV